MKDSILKILFVEDLPSDVDLAVLELKKGKLKFDYTTVCTRKDLLNALEEFKPDLIISDYLMPAFNGLQALHLVKDFNPEIPFILFTGSVNEQTAVECIKEGAVDYVIKEHLTRLPIAVKEALAQVDVRREKKASELLLKESEEKIQSIFRAAPVGIGLVVNRVFMEVNDAFCKMTGYNRGELIGKSSEIVYVSNEAYKKAGEDKYMQIKEKGIGSVETQFRHKNGRILNVLLSSAPLVPNDNSRGVTFTVLDITDRKSIEESLKLSEEKFRTIAENLTDVIFLTDTKGIVKYVSPSAKILGYSEDEYLGRFFGDFLGDGELGKALQVFSNTLNSIVISNTVLLQFKRKDGTLFYGELNGSLVHVANGEDAVLGLLRDVSDRINLEAATIESEKRYRELFMNNPLPTYIFDADSLEFIEVNDAVVKTYGYSREELASMTLKDFRVPEEVHNLVRSIEASRDGAFHSTSIRHVKKDGTIFPVEIASHPLPFKNGRRSRLVLVKDITERIEAEKQMQLAKEKAEASDNLKTTFLNNISHEVRTPLNGILGFAEIISDHTLSSATRQEYLTMLHESSDRLLDTITNYMDISLITSGSLNMNRKSFSPVVVLKKLYESYEGKCRDRNLNLSIHIPSENENLVIDSDAEIFRKIIFHLLSNAVKFTDNGSITFGFRIRGDELDVFVKDTGIGIEKKSLDIIFERFIKEERSRSRFSDGSGLGLSIARGLADILGGKLHVKSEPGNGSHFWLTLPLTGFSNEGFIPVPSRKEDNFKKNFAIMVAEDDQTNFAYLATLITRETGARIIHASNGREAIDLFNSNPDIRLILMDIKMPEVDGFEATRQIKSINPDIPVIAVTAYAMAGDEERVIAAGCDAFLSKPVDRKVLFARIAEFLNIYESKGR